MSDPTTEHGMPWNNHLPPYGVTGIVQVKVSDANDWSVPMRAEAVHWVNVTRWRYANLKAPTTPAPAPPGSVCSACIHAEKDSREEPCKSCSTHVVFGAFEPARVAAAPLATQVGGGHYKSFKIQPVEYIHANGLDYLQGNVVKYVSRHKQKNGAEDIRKAIHYLELILELQYGQTK